MMATIPPGVLTSNLCDNSCELPALLMLGQEQQLAAVQLSHYVYKLLSIISQQMTSIHRLGLFISFNLLTVEDKVVLSFTLWLFCPQEITPCYPLDRVVIISSSLIGISTRFGLLMTKPCPLYSVLPCSSCICVHSFPSLICTSSFFWSVHLIIGCPVGLQL